MSHLSSTRWLWRPVILAATITAAFASVTAPAFAKGATKAAPVLTKAEIVKLIKTYRLTQGTHVTGKPGFGAAGASGARGATGARGLTGAAGTPGAVGGTGIAGVAGTPAPGYAAGSGLTLTGTVFGVSQTAFQSPFTQSCGPYQMIVSATQAGVPTCDFGTAAFSGNRIGALSAVAFSSSTGPMVSTDPQSGAMPAGEYDLSGQLTVFNVGTSAELVSCGVELTNAAQGAIATVTVSQQTLEAKTSSGASVEDFSLAGWDALTASDAAADDYFSLSCGSSASATGLEAGNMNITAIPLTSSSSTAN